MAGTVARMAASGLIALTLGVAKVESAEAQWFRGAGYIAVGAASTATGALDDALKASGYPAFGGGAGSVGIGAYALVADRLMFGGEWVGIIKDAQELQGRGVYLGGGYGTLGAGYAFTVSPRTRVYPRIGLGGGGLGLTFETSEPSVGFADVLADPDRHADESRGFQATLTRGHAVVDLGAGAEFMPSRNGRGTFVGLRLGYVFAPSAGDWEFAKRDVVGGPSATVAGPYIRVVIGAAGWR